MSLLPGRKAIGRLVPQGHVFRVPSPASHGLWMTRLNHSLLTGKLPEVLKGQSEIPKWTFSSRFTTTKPFRGHSTNFPCEACDLKEGAKVQASKILFLEVTIFLSLN